MTVSPTIDARPVTAGEDDAPDEGGQALTAADKVVVLLASFDDGGTRSLAEIADAFAWPKSSTHRLLGTLVRHGLLERTRDRSYRLGFRTWQLARKARPYDALVRAAAGPMQRLTAITAESTFLTVAEPPNAVCVACTDGPAIVRMTLALGTAAPLHVGASNRILLAYLPPLERRDYLRRAVQDPALREALGDDLAAIRSRGWLRTTAELTPGATAIAVPVFDSEGGFIAGLSVGGPTERFDAARSDEALQHMLVAVDEIRERLL